MREEIMEDDYAKRIKERIAVELSKTNVTDLPMDGALKAWAAGDNSNEEVLAFLPYTELLTEEQDSAAQIKKAVFRLLSSAFPDTAIPEIFDYWKEGENDEAIYDTLHKELNDYEN